MRFSMLAVSAGISLRMSIRFFKSKKSVTCSRVGSLPADLAPVQCQIQARRPFQVSEPARRSSLQPRCAARLSVGRFVIGPVIEVAATARPIIAALNRTVFGVFLWVMHSSRLMPQRPVDGRAPAAKKWLTLNCFLLLESLGFP